MKLEGITTTNVLNESVTHDYDDSGFLEWAAEFAGVRSDKITKKFLDELSQDAGIIEITFSEDHAWLYVDYEDEDEAVEYAAEERGEYLAECEAEREAERYINDESSIW